MSLTPKRREMIKARLRDYGSTLHLVQAMRGAPVYWAGRQRKGEEWDPQKYLTPETIFARGNFDKYHDATAGLGSGEAGQKSQHDEFVTYWRGKRPGVTDLELEALWAEQGAEAT